MLCYADEKEKYDPSAFRDSIVQGLTEAQGDIEQVWGGIVFRVLLLLMP